MGDNIGMTDEQFETYNKLLQLVDKLIAELPTEKQKEYQQLKEDILLNLSPSIEEGIPAESQTCQTTGYGCTAG